MGKSLVGAISYFFDLLCIETVSDAESLQYRPPAQPWLKSSGGYGDWSPPAESRGQSPASRSWGIFIKYNYGSFGWFSHDVSFTEKLCRLNNFACVSLPCVIVIMHARITSGITSRYAMHCVPCTVWEVVLINLVFDNHLLHAGLSYFKTLQNHKDTASV